MIGWRRVAGFIAGLCVLVSTEIPLKAEGLSASRVLLVYSKNNSKDLADYYVQKRGVPAANILGVTISVEASYYYKDEYPKFYCDIVGPIKSALAKLGPTSIDVI